MASMVSETRFALLERTKKLVTPTEEIVGGGCWELLGVGKEMLGVGRGMRSCRVRVRFAVGISALGPV